MFASKWTDMVMGLDIHFEMVPVPPAPAPVPMPFPNPFIGIVYDPMGLLIGQAMSAVAAAIFGGAPSGIVLINGLIATNVGTEAVGVGHILLPPGVTWAPMPKFPSPTFRGPPDFPGLPIKPEDDAVAIMGSQTVTVMGASAVRMGEAWMSCGEPVRIPSSVVIAPPLGPPVFIGGPPGINLLDAIMAMIRTKWVAGYLHSLLSRVKSDRVRNVLSFLVCLATGHPVDVMTGRMWTERKDFELPGPIPLVFTRIYASSWSHRDGPLGPGWSHSLDQAVWFERGKLVYLAEDGREIEFDVFDFPLHRLSVGQEVYEPINQLTLRYRSINLIEIRMQKGEVLEFAPTAVSGGARSHWWRIQKKKHRDGHEILFAYDARGNLEWVRDSGGRLVGFEHDAQHRLVAVNLPHPSQDGWVRSFQYVYDEEGDLVQAVDEVGHSFRYAYQRHLMVQETDRNGLSFYFAYDGFNSEAYCVRTWGDGGIYDHQITYVKEAHKTVVENSLGHITTYEGNALGLVTSITDALGGVTKFEYDERTLKKTKELTSLGGELLWEYDERGNLIRTVGADGATVEMPYGAHGLPLKAIDAAGGEWTWLRSSGGRLLEMKDPLGGVTRYEYRGPWLVSVTDAAGGTTSIDYDKDGNIAAIAAPNGAITRYERDRRGRIIAITDPRGNVQRRQYNSFDYIERVTEPDGNVRILSYDREGNLVRAQDAHRDVQFTYHGMNLLASRIEAGTIVRFEHDTEGHPTGIINEFGQVYSFVFGPTGEIDAERGFDGRLRTYDRDSKGRVVRVDRGPLRAGEPHSGRRFSEYEYDAGDRIVEVRHWDGVVEKYAYRLDGELTSAAVGDVTVDLELDLLGHTIKEAQGDHWTKSEYDALGARTHLGSSLGANQVIERNIMSDVRLLKDDNAGYAVHFVRDQVGLETERWLPGGVRSIWERDQLGRPSRHHVEVRARQLRAVGYDWVPDDRLTMTVDTMHGATNYGHDAVGNLAWAQYHDGTVDLRMPDAVGNLFRSLHRNDRKYGTGGQLLEAETSKGSVKYSYDYEGNLVEKLEPSGRVWRYEWSGAGTLSKVVRPDGSEVTFSYDALGRRTKKTYRGQTTRWVWDGNNPLHEWVEGELEPLPQPSALPIWSADPAVRERETELELYLGLGPPVRGDEASPITWIFEPDGVAPMAKLVAGEAYSIVTDQVSAPVVMVDSAGRAVWQASISAYGELRGVEGAREACPFRWAGQYEDAETGLHYNHFRYYDPDSGQYISQDPTRTAGSTNLHAYVSDPLIFIDPGGLHSVFAWLEDAAGNQTPILGPGPGGTWPSTSRGRTHATPMGSFGHTEYHVLTALEGDPRLANNTLVIASVGQEVSRGRRTLSPMEPCPPCDDAMRNFAERNGTSVEYRWHDENNVPQSRCY